MVWSAQVVNDANHDFNLSVELLEDGSCHATVARDPSGVLVMRVHPHAKAAIEVPIRWLIDVLERAERDLAK